jgi:hypothetical protein
LKKQPEIKAVILEPLKKPVVKVIPNKLEVFQEIVGGYIDVVRMDGFDIIINDEGKLFSLLPNFLIHEQKDYIAGTCIFVEVDHEEGEFVSISDERIEVLKDVFPRNKPMDSVNVLGQLEREMSLIGK